MAKPALAATRAAPDAPLDVTLRHTAWSGDRLLLGREEDANKVRRRLLSASVSHSILSCEARTAADRLLPSVEDPFSARELGTSQHSIAEDLYGLEPEDRTLDTARALIEKAATAQWSLDKLARQTKAAVALNHENRKKWVEIVATGISGIFVLENPAEVRIHSRELDIKGLRIAHGPGVEAGVPSVGYIDRVDIDEDDGLVVTDYKFGKWKPHNPRFGDQYGDQMRIYRDMVAGQLDVVPSRARLIYPASAADPKIGTKAQRIVDLELSDLLLTRAMFRRAWNRQNEAADARSYRAIPSALCAWCPLANSCPVAKIGVKANAQEAAAAQPSPAALGIPTLRRGAKPEDAMWDDDVPPGPVVVPPRMRAVPKTAAADEPNRDGARTTMNAKNPAPAASTPGTRAEDAPYNETVGDALNPNSFAAIGVAGMVNDAYTLLKNAGQPVSAATWTAMSQTLAGIVLRTQEGLGGQTTFQRGINTRLRGLLKTYVEQTPFPFGKPASDIERWVANAERTIRQGIAMMDALWADAATRLDTTPYLAFAGSADAAKA